MIIILNLIHYHLMIIPSPHPLVPASSLEHIYQLLEHLK